MKRIMKGKNLRRGFRSLLAVLTALILGVYAAPAALAEAAPAYGEVKGSKVSRVFDGTLDSGYTMTTWEVAGQEDVPYVQLSEYLTILHSGQYMPSVTFTWDGNIYVITRNGQSIRADLDAQTIRCEDWRAFQGPNAPGGLPAGIVDPPEFIAIRP